MPLGPEIRERRGGRGPQNPAATGRNPEVGPRPLKKGTAWFLLLSLGWRERRRQGAGSGSAARRWRQGLATRPKGHCLGDAEQWLPRLPALCSSTSAPTSQRQGRNVGCGVPAPPAWNSGERVGLKPTDCHIVLDQGYTYMPCISFPIASV